MTHIVSHGTDQIAADQCLLQSLGIDAIRRVEDIPLWFVDGNDFATGVHPALNILRPIQPSPETHHIPRGDQRGTAQPPWVQRLIAASFQNLHQIECQGPDPNRLGPRHSWNDDAEWLAFIPSPAPGVGLDDLGNPSQHSPEPVLFAGVETPL